MTERAPKNPEEELPPIYEQCPNCDQEYAHAEDNTKLFLFDKQPECNYVACRCPECRDTAIYLIDLSWAASVIKRGVPVKAEDYASDENKAGKPRLAHVTRRSAGGGPGRASARASAGRAGAGSAGPAPKPAITAYRTLAVSEHAALIEESLLTLDA